MSKLQCPWCPYHLIDGKAYREQMKRHVNYKHSTVYSEDDYEDDEDFFNTLKEKEDNDESDNED